MSCVNVWGSRNCSLIRLFGTLFSPDGKKKAYVRLTSDHDALDVANKVCMGIVRKNNWLRGSRTRYSSSSRSDSSKQFGRMPSFDLNLSDRHRPRLFDYPLTLRSPSSRKRAEKSKTTSPSALTTNSRSSILLFCFSLVMPPCSRGCRGCLSFPFYGVDREKVLYREMVVDEDDSFTWWEVTDSQRSGCYRDPVLLVV